MTRSITFIGVGEAGGAIVEGWGANMAQHIRAYDVKTDTPETAAEIWARYEKLGLAGAESSAEGLQGAELVFCTVTADQAVVAADAAAPFLFKGAYWFDLNSCAPSSKRRSSQIIEGAGGRYVDVAVMAPIYPGLNMVPLLVAGPHATAAAAILAELPMNPRVVEGDVGAASSIKMIRSIMVKGMEALTAECVLAAVAAGVEDEVLGSLQKSFAEIDWSSQAAYNFERSMLHGIRRAAEMEEVVKTVSDIGLPSDMSRATVEWQRRVASAGVVPPKDAHAVGSRELALALLEKLRS